MRASLPKVGLPKVGLPKVGLPKVGPPHLGAVRAALASRLRPGARFERFAWLPAGVAIAALVVLVSVFSGTVESSDVTLVLMGFDPDRAQLITALIIGAIAAGAVTLVVNRNGFATMLGAYALAALYTQTFVTETQNAVAATGALGSFDLGGWTLTLVTLAVIAFVAAWAGATLGAAMRPGLIASAVDVRDIAKARRPSRHLVRRPLALLIVAVLLTVTVPAFGDMVNLSPDALMLNGNHAQGLIHDNPTIDPSLLAQATDTPSPSPSTPSSSPSSMSGESPSLSPSPSPMVTAKPGTKPWLAWKPTGPGRVTKVDMLAPWVGGSKNTSELDIYLPAGYDQFGARLYPVLYEAPTGLPLWDKGTGVIGSLDALIESGDMPASIVVFIDSSGPPHPDTECADHVDGKQWFETYISKTVVDFVDSHYKTIKDPRARGIMGMSAGGFCAPMLALRHPETFSISISFSGYFWAGAAGNNSAEPFGDQGYNLHSPVLLANKLATMDRAHVYLVIIACMSQDFYAPAAQEFEKVLGDNGYKYLAVNSLYTHGWPQVRYETPGAMEAWGAQLVVNGIW